MLTFGQLRRSDLTAPLNGLPASVCKAIRALGSGKLNSVEDLVRSQWVDFDVDNLCDDSIAP